MCGDYFSPLTILDQWIFNPLHVNLRISSCIHLRFFYLKTLSVVRLNPKHLSRSIIMLPLLLFLCSFFLIDGQLVFFIEPFLLRRGSHPMVFSAVVLIAFLSLFDFLATVQCLQNLFSNILEYFDGIS